MTKRDPRSDPKAGDELIYGPQWQREWCGVLARKGEEVHYRIGPMRAVVVCALKDWREWMQGAEVTTRGDQSGRQS